MNIITLKIQNRYMFMDIKAIQKYANNAHMCHTINVWLLVYNKKKLRKIL